MHLLMVVIDARALACPIMRVFVCVCLSATPKKINELHRGAPKPYYYIYTMCECGSFCLRTSPTDLVCT